MKYSKILVFIAIAFLILNGCSTLENNLSITNEIPEQESIESETKEKLSDSQEELLVFKEQGKYGYVNDNGEVIIDPIYDTARDFSNELAVVKENEKHGYINKQGEYEIEPRFDQAKDFQEGLAYVENSIFKGIINKKGESILEIHEEEIDSFEDGNVKIVKNGYYGYVDNEGNFLVNDRKNLVPKKLDYKYGLDVWGYISEENDLIAIGRQFQEANEFIDGIALIKKKNYYGYINLEGEFLVEGLDEAYDFNDGKGLGRKQEIWNYYDDTGNIIELKYNNSLAKIEIGDKTGFIDKAGKIIYDQDSRLLLWQHNDKYGYLDQNKNIAVSPRYSEATKMKNGFAGVKEENQHSNGRWTYIDIDGEQLLEFQFDEVNSFNTSGIAIVKSRDKYGFINKKGDYVIRPIFDGIENLEDGKTKYKINDYEGFINESGELIKVNYKTLKPKLFEITYSTKSWGYINEENHISILPKYDYAEIFDENDNAFIMEEQMLGFIDKQGNYVLKPQFSQIKEFSEGLAAVKKDNRWGYINIEKNIIIEPKFDYANNFKNGEAKIIIDDQYGIIDKEGNPINGLKPIKFNQNYHGITINSTEELLELINNKIQDTEKEIADEMIEDLIKFLKENELKEYKKYKKNRELKSRKLFNHYIKDEGYYEYLDRTLYIDYRKIYENYSQYLSNELNDYLEIKYNQKEKPLLQDAALTISLDTFVERITTYETFMNSYPDSKYLEEVAESFKLMMSILIYPNFGNTRYFEGVPRSELNKQNKPKEDFIDVYKEIIHYDKKSKISQTVAKKLLNTVEKSDNDDLSDMDLQQFIKDVELKIEEKYLNNN